MDDELKKSMAELERFNRLAVGRELKMIELKNEVNRLYERLDEKPRYRLALENEKTTGNEELRIKRT
jgi:predicted  nucleic acid-binding Zn-ribbon protein